MEAIAQVASFPSERALDDGAPRRPAPRWLLGALAIFLGWTFVGLLGLGRGVLSGLSGGGPLPPHALRETLVSVWLWAALTPLILHLARRYPLSTSDGGGALAAHLALHLCAAALVHAADVLLDTVLMPLVGAPLHGGIARRLAGESFINVFSYLATLACGHALAYHRLYHERLSREAALQAQLSRARLQALEMQLRPHFLFNALHTIGSLVRDGQRDEAVRAVAELSELLRAVLREGGAREVPVRRELELVERYLHLQRARFPDRLVVRSAVEPAALEALVPGLILQPLAENAIRHGVEATDGPVEIDIGARVEGDTLWLTVRNSAAASPDLGALGIGLSNTRERLRQLYGDRQRLELRAVQGGTLAAVALPLRRPAAPEARRG